MLVDKYVTEEILMIVEIIYNFKDRNEQMYELKDSFNDSN